MKASREELSAPQPQEGQSKEDPTSYPASAAEQRNTECCLISLHKTALEQAPPLTTVDRLELKHQMISSLPKDVPLLGNRYPLIPLPKELGRFLQSPICKMSRQGFIRIGKYGRSESNGHLLTRAYFGWDQRLRVAKEIRNQFTKEELTAIEKAIPEGRLPSFQIGLYRTVLAHIQSYLKDSLGHGIYSVSASIARFEVCRNYQVTESAQAFREAMGRAVSSIAGEPEYNDHTLTARRTGDQFNWIVTLHKRRRDQSFMIKCYRKNGQIRLEISSMNFPSAKNLSDDRDYDTLFKDLMTLCDQSVKILDAIHSKLAVTYSKRDVALLWQALRLCGVKGLKTDRRWEILVWALDQYGTYTPSRHRELGAINPKTLKQLSNSTKGFLHEERTVGINRQGVLTYRLREDWAERALAILSTE